MRMARHADQIRNVADLSIREAATLIDKADEPEPGTLEWAEAQMNGPFSDYDFEAANKDWLEQKLLHHVGAPDGTAISLGLMRDYGVGLYFTSNDEIIENHQALKESAGLQRTVSADADASH